MSAKPKTVHLVMPWCIPLEWPYIVVCRRWYKPVAWSGDRSKVTCRGCLRWGSYPHCPGRTFLKVYTS